MERTNKTWKNTGGSFRMASGMIIKPGQIFTAGEHEIPTAFRDVIFLYDPKQEAEKEKAEKSPKEAEKAFVKSPVKEEPVKVEKPEEVYSIKKTTKGYNVVDTTGKAINGTPLQKEEAEQLLKDLNA